MQHASIATNPMPKRNRALLAVLCAGLCALLIARQSGTSRNTHGHAQVRDTVGDLSLAPYEGPGGPLELTDELQPSRREPVAADTASRDWIPATNELEARTDPDAADLTLAGRVVLRDGAPPPELLLVARVSGESPRVASSAKTSADGSFLFDLPQGRYDLYTGEGSRRTKEALEAGQDDVLVVLNMVRVAVAVEDSNGKPLAGVRANLAVRPDSAEPYALSELTDRSGVIEWLVAHTGTATVAAYSFDGSFGEISITVTDGISATVTPLRLMPARNPASLALSVRCRESSRAMSFTARLNDPTRRLQVRRIESEDLALDRFLRNVPPGTYELWLNPREYATPSLNLENTRQLVTLEPGEEREVELVVDCGGRVRVRAEVADPRSKGQAGVQILLRADDTEEWEPLGLGKSELLTLDELRNPSRASTGRKPVGNISRVLVPGTYWVKAEAENRASEPVRVAVRAGEFEDVVLVLPRAE